jgi:hypothetical protein
MDLHFEPGIAEVLYSFNISVSHRISANILFPYGRMKEKSRVMDQYG